METGEGLFWFISEGPFHCHVALEEQSLFTSWQTGSREGIQEGAMAGYRHNGILLVTYFFLKLWQPPTLAGYQGWVHETERRGSIPNSSWNTWIKMLTSSVLTSISNKHFTPEHVKMLTNIYILAFTLCQVLHYICCVGWVHVCVCGVCSGVCAHAEEDAGVFLYHPPLYCLDTGSLIDLDAHCLG